MVGAVFGGEVLGVREVRRQRSPRPKVRAGHCHTGRPEKDPQIAISNPRNGKWRQSVSPNKKRAWRMRGRCIRDILEHPCRIDLLFLPALPGERAYLADVLCPVPGPANPRRPDQNAAIVTATEATVCTEASAATRDGHAPIVRLVQVVVVVFVRVGLAEPNRLVEVELVATAEQDIGQAK